MVLSISLIMLVVSSACTSVMPLLLSPEAAQGSRAAAMPGGSRTPRQASAEWPAHPVAVERAFRAPLIARTMRDVQHGRTNTKRVEVHSPSEGFSFDVKWKPARASLDGINNSPRREVAAYELQRIVLEPEDYVVPTTSIVCWPMDAISGGVLGEPNIAGADCVVGSISVWLRDLAYPSRKVDWDRFQQDPWYAYHSADLNLVAILLDHSDTHTRNLLVAEAPSSPRIYSIDNGISFNHWFRSPFSRDWNRLRVPGLRAETVKRLKRLSRRDLDYLRVVAQLQVDGSGGYRVTTPSAPLAGASPVRMDIEDGIVQFGLTESEIEGIWRRTRQLLRLVEAEQIPVF